MEFDAWAFDRALTDEDMLYYLDVLRGDVAYDGYDERVVRFEAFLFSWITRDHFPKKNDMMVRLSTLGLVDYSYTGEVYRGISLMRGKTLSYGYVTSFTSSDAVAEYFGAGDEKHYRGYLFAMTGETFDLSALMRDVMKWTNRTALLDAIDRNLWEEEKIGYFDESCEDMSEDYVFNDWEGLYD